MQACDATQGFGLPVSKTGLVELSFRGIVVVMMLMMMMVVMVLTQNSDTRRSKTKTSKRNQWVCFFCEGWTLKNQRLGASFETSWGSFLHNNLFTPNNWKVDVPHKKKNSGRYKLLYFKLNVYTSKRNSLA